MATIFQAALPLNGDANRLKAIKAAEEGIVECLIRFRFIS